jgi:hypothetical protein
MNIHSDEYQQSLLLDDLESLLEEIEEQEDEEPSGELLERMDALGIESVSALRMRIRSLHEELGLV